MSTGHPKDWDKAVVAQLDEAQLAIWKQALVDAKGDITDAAVLAGIGRATGTRLNRKFSLIEFAAELRAAAGAARTASGPRKGVVGSLPGKPRSRK